MRLNRVVCGGIAGVVGLLAAFLVSEVETRLFGASTHRYFWAAFLGVGGALMWVADWFGLLSPRTVRRRLMSMKSTTPRATPTIQGQGLST
jgi:ABC-type Fe3+-siderophore transport system permease subunit